MLIPICDNIWCVQSGMYMPGKLLHFSLRMTIVRLNQGELVLISPVKLDEALAVEIRALGKVAYIIAPNTFHHLYAGAVQALFPGSKLYGARGLHKKRPDLKFDGMIDDNRLDPWRNELDQMTIQGCPSFNEVVFFHRATGTLIVTDLAFNVHTYQGALTGLMLRLVGAHKRFAQSRAWRMITKDRAAAKQSVQALLAWDIRRVVVAHGDILETECKPALEKALAWMNK